MPTSNMLRLKHLCSFLAIAAGFTFGAEVELESYTQTVTTANYLYQRYLPALSESTFCYWTYAEATDDDARTEDYIFTISVSANDNELAFGFPQSQKFTFRTSGGDVFLPGLQSQAEIDTVMVGWHRHCTTWKAGGNVNFFADVNEPGVLELVSTVAAKTAVIRDGGALILRQEQDSHFGSLNAGQVIAGKMAGFNLWDYEMTPEEVLSLGCRDQGNIVNWNTLLETGSAARTLEKFECSDAPLKPSLPIEMEVYTQTATTSNFLYQRDLPALSETTICFWFFADEEEDRASDWFFTLSTTNDANDMHAGYISAQKLRFWASGTYVDFPQVSNEAAADRVMIGWHRHCLTWKAGGQFRYYADLNRPGVLELVGIGKAGTGTIAAGGNMVVLQEQDSLFGSFDANQVYTGKIACFNMWDYELTVNELNTLQCRDLGNLINWNTLQEMGTTERHYETFFCPETSLLDQLQPKSYKSGNQQMTFCQVKGVSFPHHVVSTQTVSNKKECMLRCLDHSECYSVNYQLSSGTCELNSHTDSNSATDLLTDLGSDHVHFTTRECDD